MYKYKKGAQYSHKLLGGIYVDKSFKSVEKIFEKFFYSDKKMFIISIFSWQNKNIWLIKHLGHLFKNKTFWLGAYSDWILNGNWALIK